MAAAKSKLAKDSVLSEEAMLAQKYSGQNKQAGGMNSILQKRLNKGVS